MNRLSTEKRAQIIGCLVEGMSIRATVRITGAAKNTVTKLLVDIGRACEDYQDKHLRNLSCKHLQCDEIWSFCYSKQKNVPEEYQGVFGVGDVWTWTAIDAETKLIPTWFVGNRTSESAKIFMDDLADRLASRVQLTTDGHTAYIDAVEGAFGTEIDYAMLVKHYGNEGGKDAARKYSPAKYKGAKKTAIMGMPERKHVSTSYVERQNLTMRMSMRRFTRLTNGFSKKIDNHAAAIALHFMYYNYGRVHKTLRVTPAMEAGIADHIWTLEEIAGLLDSN